MRALALIALVLAGCSALPGASPAASPAMTDAPVTSSPVAVTTEPTVAPTTAPTPNTVYTADDEQLAELIRAGSAEAIPQIKLIRVMDPEERSVLFLPLLEWITSQREAVEAFEPSSCTSAAVALYIDGIDQYDSMRKRFLAWRDWGAHNDPFSPAAPGQAVKAFEEALVELEASCPT